MLPVFQEWLKARQQCYSFGYFVGRWGKPSVDEEGRPLYGDVFGVDSGKRGLICSSSVLFIRLLLYLHVHSILL